MIILYLTILNRQDIYYIKNQTELQDDTQFVVEYVRVFRNDTSIIDRESYYDAELANRMAEFRTMNLQVNNDFKNVKYYFRIYDSGCPECEGVLQEVSR